MDEQTNQAQPKQSTGKSNTTLIVVIVLAAVVILGVGGYFVSRYFIKRAAGNLADSFINSATNGVVDADINSGSVKVGTGDGSIDLNQNSTWPADMPSDVPQFTYGKVAFSSKIDSGNTKGWTVTIENVPSGSLEKYKKDLEAKGWIAQAESTDLGFASILQYEKGDNQIMTSYDPDSKGVNLTVTNKL